MTATHPSLITPPSQAVLPAAHRRRLRHLAARVTAWLSADRPSMTAEDQAEAHEAHTLALLAAREVERRESASLHWRPPF